MTRFMEALNAALARLERMHPAKTAGLFLVIMCAIAVTGFYFYTAWFPRDMWEIMRKNVELTGQVEILRKASAEARRIADEDVEYWKKQNVTAQSVAAAEREAKRIAEAKLSDFAAANKSLAEDLKESRKRENAGAGDEVARLGRELTNRSAQHKRELDDANAREVQARAAAKDAQRQLGEVLDAHRALDTQLRQSRRDADDANTRYRALESSRDSAIAEKDRQILALQEKLAARPQEPTKQATPEKAPPRRESRGSLSSQPENAKPKPKPKTASCANAPWSEPRKGGGLAHNECVTVRVDTNTCPSGCRQVCGAPNQATDRKRTCL